MNSREAIAKLNILSSYDTEKEKREEYKECIYAIIKDLDLLDKYKRVMGEPIKDIMKELELKDLLEIELNVEKLKIEYLMKQLKKQDKILEILKEFLSDADTGTGWIEININPNHDILDSEEHKKKQLLIKEWLENDKH